MGGHGRVGGVHRLPAQRHGQAGGEVLHPLGHGQGRQGAGQQTHAEHGEEPHYQTVQALGAGDHLKDHDLTKLTGVLAEQAGAGLTGKAGALGGADAGQHRRQTRAQQGDGQTADLPQRGKSLLHFYQSVHIHVVFPP